MIIMYMKVFCRCVMRSKSEIVSTCRKSKCQVMIPRQLARRNLSSNSSATLCD